jgi:hypothetical protein
MLSSRSAQNDIPNFLYILIMMDIPGITKLLTHQGNHNITSMTKNEHHVHYDIGNIEHTKDIMDITNITNIKGITNIAYIKDITDIITITYSKSIAT